MPQEIYEIIALGARWWFILLGVLIVLRAFGWLRRDGRRAKRRLRQLPDAGMVGEMVVVIGNKELEAGMVMTVPREGTLGSYRSCDLVIPAEGVAPAHCDFSFVDGQGLLLYPRRRCPVKIDGEEFIRRGKAKKHPMSHGSRLQVGDAVLRLRLFEGLDAPRSVYVRDAWRDDMPDDGMDEAWQVTDDIYHQSPMAWDDAPKMPAEEAYPPYQGYPPQGGYQPNPYQQHPYAAQPYSQPETYQPAPDQPAPYQQQPWQMNGYQGEPYQNEPYQPNPYQRPADNQQAPEWLQRENEYNPAWSPAAEEMPRARHYRSRRRRSDEET